MQAPGLNHCGRLAPSPTGAQHLGNARTYLIAYWSARVQRFDLTLRIEDIDSPRVKSWAVRQAIDDLKWLGLSWTAGPDIGGPNEPYVQTERLKHYRAAIARLRDADRIYPCTCTRKDIEAAGSAPHFEHEGPVYPGTCAVWRNGDPMPDHGTFSWRFRASSREIAFVDAVLGDRRCVPSTALGDFPITQKSGSPSYQLAVVVDDAAMNVREIVRGNDLVASTFRQIDLLEALRENDDERSANFRVPRYAHVPLVRGPDGRRLAKRHGDTRLSQYREAGVAAAAVISWAARSCGWLPDGETISHPDDLLDRVAGDDGDAAWDRLVRDDVVVDAEGGLLR